MEIKNQQKGVIQTVVIPFDLRTRLIDLAKEKGASISSVVCEALKEKLNTEKEIRTLRK